MHKDTILKSLNLDQIDLVLIALLVGCDYLPRSVSQIGLKKALFLIRTLEFDLFDLNNFKCHPKYKFINWLVKNNPQTVNEFRQKFGEIRLSESKIAKLWIHVGNELQDVRIEDVSLFLKKNLFNFFILFLLLKKDNLSNKYLIFHYFI